VASDQNTGVIDPEFDQSESVIENQIANYRAVSVRAILSVFFGVLALFSFASETFYVAAILAIVFGVLAKRAIHRYPDMLTGERLANAGIAMGLIFGLVTVTYSGVQTFIRTREATKFAAEYVKVMESASDGEMLWYNIPPVQRQEKSAKQALLEFEKAKGKDRMMLEQKLQPWTALRRRLKSSTDQHLKFAGVESVGLDETRGGEGIIYAVVVFEADGLTSKDYPGPQFAAAIIKAKTSSRHYEWWVEDLRFPYTPKSFVPTPPPKADDGHGHSH
jgi:hypothetical protein